MGAPAFSVVVPCYNAQDTIARVLDALFEMSPAPLEVIVVDDGSADSSPQIASRYPVHLVRHESNRGVAAARNRGASLAQGDIVCFVDADVVVPRDLIARFAEHLAAHPDCVAVTALVDPSSNRFGFLSEYLNLRMYYGFSHLRGGVTTVCTACVAIRRKALLEVGGFDEAATHAVNDEAVIGWRLAAWNYRADIAESIQVRHLKRMSLASWVAKFWNEGSQWVLVARRHLRQSSARTKLALNLRRPTNVLVVALLIGSVAAVPILGARAVYLAGVLSIVFLAANASYLRFMAKARSARWAAATLPMLVLESTLHLAGMVHGLIVGMGRA